MNATKSLPCRTCHGSGRTMMPRGGWSDQPCPDCDGRGIVELTIEQANEETARSIAALAKAADAGDRYATGVFRTLEAVAKKG